MNLELQTALRRLITGFNFEPGENAEAAEKSKQSAQETVCREIDKLVRKGADPREFKEFPLRLASRYGLLVVVKHLIRKYKSDDSVYDYEALADSIDNGHLDVARFLSKRMRTKLMQKPQTPTF